jgi:hypothetical protein
MTTTYRTAGTTDEITTCGICGREELRGTVRLEIVTVTGEVEGEVFAGTSCAGTVAGRSATVITREARDADRDAAEAARQAEFQKKFDAEQKVLDRLGLERTFANVKHIRTLMKAAA